MEINAFILALLITLHFIKFQEMFSNTRNAFIRWIQSWEWYINISGKPKLLTFTYQICQRIEEFGAKGLDLKRRTNKNVLTFNLDNHTRSSRTDTTTVDAVLTQTWVN
jgi:hypothetical protein